MNKQLRKSLFCISLVLVMLVTTISGSYSPVFAEDGSGGSEDDPYVATNFAKFKEALETESIKFVKVGDIDGEVIKLPKEEQFIYAVTVKGEKTLILSGKAEFYAPADESHASIGSLIHLKKPADLTIKGEGSLIFKAVMSNAFNAVVLIEGGSLTVDSEDVHLIGDYNTASYGRAIEYYYGWLTINDGNFIGKRATVADNITPAVSIRAPRESEKEKVIINGGRFFTEIKDGGFGIALKIDEKSDKDSVVIRGGTFLGARSGKDYSIAITDGTDISKKVNISQYLDSYTKLYDYSDRSIEVDSNRPQLMKV